MSASQKYDVLCILYLKCHQQADRLEGVKTFVHVVAQEDVFITLHLTLVGEPEAVEDLQQVIVASVYTSENLDRSPDSEQRRLSHNNLRSLLAQPINLVLLEWKERGGRGLAGVGRHEDREYVIYQLDGAEVKLLILGLTGQLLTLLQQTVNWYALDLDVVVVTSSHNHLVRESDVFGLVYQTAWR